jgi:hypothetical protein
MKKTRTNFCQGLLLLSLWVFISIKCGAEIPAAAVLHSWQKPAWLADLSLSMKESYDDNVFLSGASQKFLPPSFTLPKGSIAALKDRSSWVTAISPRAGVNFAPLLEGQQILQTLSLIYAPDFTVYHNQSSESYDAQRFGAAIKGTADTFSFSVDNTFTYIDGSKFGPTYPGGFVSAYSTAADRERRDQIQDRGTIAFQYDSPDWFVRPTAAILFYDLGTKQFNIPGYQNYSDRYDVNGGADFGYRIKPGLAVTTGYRYGCQYQQQFRFSPYSSSSDYHRVLPGIEGKPVKWLDVKIQGGPDFRNYRANSASHITPVSDKNLITYYGEASLSATVSPNDVLAFKYKQWQWVSSCGKIPYFDSTYDLSYHRNVTSKLGLDLTGRFLSSDYTSGNISISRRDDRQYTFAASLNYAFNSHVNASFTYALNLGRNAQDGITNPQTREFDQQLISIGAQYKF